MENSRDKGLIGGILSIASGVIGVLYGIFIAVLIPFFLNFMTTSPYTPGMGPLPRDFFTMMVIIYSVMGGAIALVGILGIVGGVLALKRKVWGLALAGAVAGAITFFPCGIAAVILVSLGKPEFANTPRPPAQNSTNIEYTESESHILK
jgi:hypothetical protein